MKEEADKSGRESSSGCCGAKYIGSKYIFEEAVEPEEKRGTIF